VQRLRSRFAFAYSSGSYYFIVSKKISHKRLPVYYFYCFGPSMQLPFVNNNSQHQTQENLGPFSQWGKSPKKQSVGVYFDNWHCILSAELIKRHSFRLLFWRFCPLGWKRRLGILFSLDNMWMFTFYQNNVMLE